MEVFAEFEDGMNPWNKSTFIDKCSETYTRMPPGDRNELLKIFNPKVQEKI